ncbi:YbdD/YjiX family protein [Fictibacillus phosphorivorans]|uniref:YbdD/YjiX family protein n=1 Tax=Fictibacillus phosphorivorans TaxID=1221500 RepID=UPI0020409276|nr:YbdD/YjiX family protein [Fictibacillus phosphorivorans]MCM3719987.1 YbdD/YjiX family protein [Fictibacillus phosphorivorans]MCM3777656.1 YbdD/YjiX family protein [Fictibacillus phosphorivorans]
MSIKALWGRLRKVFRVISYIGKGIANLPDYQAYVRHLEEKHPEKKPPTEKEFFAELLENKYGAHAKRCC